MKRSLICKHRKPNANNARLIARKVHILQLFTANVPNTAYYLEGVWVYA